eukprot:scaffold1075_cov197-Prasinococcus_capsulatus_cf.AAC.3
MRSSRLRKRCRGLKGGGARREAPKAGAEQQQLQLRVVSLRLACADHGCQHGSLVETAGGSGDDSPPSHGSMRAEYACLCAAPERRYEASQVTHVQPSGISGAPAKLGASAILQHRQQLVGLGPLALARSTFPGACRRPRRARQLPQGPEHPSSLGHSPQRQRMREELHARVSILQQGPQEPSPSTSATCASQRARQAVGACHEGRESGPRPGLECSDAAAGRPLAGPCCWGQDLGRRWGSAPARGSQDVPRLPHP